MNKNANNTDRVLLPSEEGELLKRGYGITNLVARATATADALSAEELIQGRQHQLKDLARLFQNLREATEEDI